MRSVQLNHMFHVHQQALGTQHSPNTLKEWYGDMVETAIQKLLSCNPATTWIVSDGGMHWPLLMHQPLGLPRNARPVSLLRAERMHRRAWLLLEPRKPQVRVTCTSEHGMPPEPHIPG